MIVSEAFHSAGGNEEVALKDPHVRIPFLFSWNFDSKADM